MQHQQREAGERISWARALIFAVGFFFLAALLVGQIPSFINLQMTSSSLVGMEQAMIAFALICFGGFLIVQAIVMLFDPKPVVPPIIFTGLGLILTIVGIVLIFWAVITGNQTIPLATPGWHWNSLLGGIVLWFPANALDLVALGAVILFVGVAWVFYSVLAVREQSNPDRRDPGTTPAIRIMITIGTVMLVAFMLFFAFVSPDGLAKIVDPSCAEAATTACGWSTGLFWVNTTYNLFLIVAIFCTLGAFALRLHYLMRPTRKNTMSGLYAVGVNLAPIGALCLVVWFALYPFIYWLHGLPGLGPYFVVCARLSAIPQSCGFAQDGGNLIGSILTMNGFAILMAAIWGWRTKRNMIVIGSLVIVALLALTTLLTHIEYTNAPYEATIALIVCAAGLILATVWTSVARREFAVVGEKPLGCLGMWLVVGTCFFIYIASFAFFSLPGFGSETETDIPFSPGAIIGTKSQLDALVVIVIIGLLAAIQFYFLVRNRYRV